MIYVPTPPPPSAAARDLSQKLDQAIRDYCARHQNVGPTDVRQALQLSATAHGPPGPKVRTIILTAIGMVVALGIGLVVSLQQRAAAVSGAERATPAIWIAVVVLAAGAGVAIALRRRMGG